MKLTQDRMDWMRAHEEAFRSLRRDLHENPELGFQELRTSGLVARQLESWGYQVERGIGGTGLVAQMRLGSSSRRLGLRAEMDALPIVELSGLAHASRKNGVMHACGHDGHTTMLLYAAQCIAREKSFDGTLNLIFQPAEEGLAGARRMMEEGLFERYPCDAIFAMHNLPGLAQGQLHLRSGPCMASGDTVTIKLQGRGGHGAMPHLSADPTVAAANVILALQTVVSRNVDPLQAVVVSVGVMKAGHVRNVIPDSAELVLTVRVLDPSIRGMVEQRIVDLVRAQAQSYGVQAEIDYARGYPVLVNDEQATRFAHQVACDMLPADQVVFPCVPTLASEDFAFMLEKVPGCYLFIGNGTGEQGGCSVHNPHYDFNDRNLPVGAAYWVRLVDSFLSPQS